MEHYSLYKLAFVQYVRTHTHAHTCKWDNLYMFIIALFGLSYNEIFIVYFVIIILQKG